MGKSKVVVGMSGGVDSSVSALLLKKQGYDVIGLFMKNWDDPGEDGTCSTKIDFEDVAAVCRQIDIPYYTVNFTQDYQEKVFSHFLREYQAGRTPNPDILCNREIKFQMLLDKAFEIGAHYLATGHYCQIGCNHELLKGSDPGKDQSYFLYALKKGTLENVLFPVGGLPKKEVREIAKKYDLATSEKKDSTGICFIGERNFRNFLSQYLPIQPGPMQTLEGRNVGEHMGVAYYTIGQRKGLKIGGQGEAWFVVGKDPGCNILYVEQGENHPALFASNLEAIDLSWVSGYPPTPLPFACNSKVRYRQPDQHCIITSIENGKAYVEFPNPQRAVTPGQSIVFYDGEICLGGGVIHRSNAMDGQCLPTRSLK